MGEAAAIIEKLAGLYTPADPPTIHERVAAYFWGQPDEDVAWCLGLCDMVAADPVAKHLYYFSCADEMAGNEAVRVVEDWCHGMAAESALCIGKKRQPRVPSYRPEWGRQAGKDGAALAMWGENIRDLLPGVNKRAEKYGCRDAAYLTVRRYVEQEAAELIFTFRRDMEMADAGRFDPHFRSRWESKTGKPFPRG